MDNYFIDTHSHIYLKEYDKDRRAVVEEANKVGVKRILLPNIDSTTMDDLLALSKRYPKNIFPMVGLHPTSVEEDFEKELSIIEESLKKETFYAIGECGLDLYWDKTFLEEQKKAFEYQIDLALKHDLPLVIHAREAFDEIFEILDAKNTPELRGVFHSFTGNKAQANKIIQDYNFLLGINGIVTFKNAHLPEVVAEIDLQHLVLETDAPFLAPTPKRGKRNESAYLYYIARKIADIHQVPIQELASITTQNAENLFKLPKYEA